MALVVDYATYLKWFNDGNQDQATTINNIRYFFSYQYNGMQRIYSSIPSSDLSINVWIRHLAIQITDTESAALQFDPNLDAIHPRRNNAKLNKGNFKAFIQRWKNNNGYRVPQDYDHVMYFVPYKIEGAIGSSIIAGVCRHWVLCFHRCR